MNGRSYRLYVIKRAHQNSLRQVVTGMLATLLSMSIAGPAFAAVAPVSQNYRSPVHTLTRSPASAAHIFFQMSKSSHLTRLFLLFAPSSMSHMIQRIELFSGRDFTQVGKVVTLTNGGMQWVNQHLKAGGVYHLRVYGVANGRLVGMASLQHVVSYVAPQIEVNKKAPEVRSGTTEKFLSGDGQQVPHLSLPNAATNDQQDWQRASRSLYLFADTQNPLQSSQPPSVSLTQVQVGMPLALVAYKNGRTVQDAKTTWAVNSPDALITRSPNSQLEQVNGKQVASAVFVAKRPGIYTIQADNQGQYSVPLVITVGLQKLKSTPFMQPSASMGIQPLPGDLPSTQASQSGSITYTAYPAQGMLIPISGQAQGLTGSISVLLLSGGQEWSYRLPVSANGSFSGQVESPFVGSVTVVLLPHFLSTLTKTQGTVPNSDLTAQYSVTTSGVAPAATQLGLLSSATMDDNLDPSYLQVADALIENSPSVDTAIQAINNYVSDQVIYNTSELNPGKYIWQDAITTNQTQSGVCENYAQLAAAMLRIVGIPTETVGGYADSTWTSPNFTDTNPNDAHEWIQAWNGSQWILADPTWTDGDQTVNSQMTNAFFTNTVEFAQTHAQQASSTGTDFSIVKPSLHFAR